MNGTAADAVPGWLVTLAGEWCGDERIEATPWGPGGPASSRVSARSALAGRVLLQDYSSQRDGVEWLQAHAVFEANDASDMYRLYWFDSLGFAPDAPAPGTCEGDSLSFLRVSPRGRTRHCYRLVDVDHYTLALDSSLDGGGHWFPVMHGVYTRID